MSLVSSVVARLLPLAALVPAQVLVQVLVQVLAQALVQVQECLLVLVVATEVFLLHFCCSPVVVFPELVIRVLSRLQTGVVSVHLLPTRVAPQSRWLVPSQVQPARQQSQCSGIPKLQTSPLTLP